MGGHRGGGVEVMEWPADLEPFFLELLAERVKMHPNGAPSFKSVDWEEMDAQVFAKSGLAFGVERLKQKYQRLRATYTKFNELISNTGVTWDSNSGQVFASDSIWNDYLKRDKIFKTFKNKGCKLFPLMGAVFANSSATGAFHNASTSMPQTSEEERMVEDTYLGVEAGADAESSRGKRPSEGDLECLPGNRRVRKNSGKAKYDTLLDAMSRSFLAREEHYMAKAERYKSQSKSHSGEVTSSMGDEYGIEKCMAELSKIEGVSTDSFNKALEKFDNPNWRKMFILMPDERRKPWLDNLA